MKFSVVVPTRDRPEQLMHCVEALNAMTPASAWELIIVDDGSATPVNPPAVSGARTVLVRETGRGPAAARNAGARAASGEVLVFVDDDCRADRDLLLALDHACNERPGSLLGGRLIHGMPENFWSTVTHAVTQAAYDIQERYDRRPRRFSTSLLAVPRAGFLELGGFDEQFARPGGEDYEFCERWQASGRAAFFAPAVAVTHFHPLTFRRFASQQKNYGRGLARGHVQQRGAPVRRSLGAKLADVLAIIFWPLSHGGGPRLSAGVLIAQMWTALGAAETMLGSGRVTPQAGSQ